MKNTKEIAISQLSASDWEEIYYALDYKLTSPAVRGDRKG
jgi:hypothetical protein